MWERPKSLKHLLQLNKPLIRLQCYEGLDINAAAYEWNYARQMVDIQAGKIADKGNTLFTETYLIARPLLQAIRPPLESPCASY